MREAILAKRRMRILHGTSQVQQRSKVPTGRLLHDEHSFIPSPPLVPFPPGRWLYKLGYRLPVPSSYLMAKFRCVTRFHPSFDEGRGSFHRPRRRVNNVMEVGTLKLEVLHRWTHAGKIRFQGGSVIHLFCNLTHSASTVPYSQ